jgi:hypothetical protein
MVLLSVLICEPAWGGEDRELWKLAWEDDFNRAEVGDEWFQWMGESKIVDGRLYLWGGCATLLTERRFQPDVMLEFIAEADRDKPACDLSAAVAADKCYGWWHILAFGGRSNQVNQIYGGGASIVDKSPSLLIEYGKKYKMTAVKEGTRLTYYVDGVKIIENDDPDPLGGPGFDRVGLITWTGMYVDDFKVYERITPAANGPTMIHSLPDVGYGWDNRKLSYTKEATEAIQRGVAAYNQRNYEEAFQRFANISPPSLASVAGLAYVIGDVGYQEDPGDQQKIADLAAEVAGRSPDDQGAQIFARAAKWFSGITLAGRDRRSATRLHWIGPANNPFYYKASLYRTRYKYASILEFGGQNTHHMKTAMEEFNELKTIWPEHRGLRELTGEKILWGRELIRDESEGPLWARYIQESLARTQAILNWWFTKRQAPDGQLGGGWGDDVEILRSWVPIACITTANETIIAGIERMARTVAEDILKNGYMAGTDGDVEHAAEPGADTLPTMMLLRYGDPQYVEYNLRSAKTLHDVAMGVDRRGFLHFKSVDFGSDGVNTHPRSSSDTFYHARPMKHFLWLAWYGIPEARDVFVRWCDGWRDVTMRKMGTKPVGYVPASVFYPSGDINHPSGRGWHDQLSHYYYYSSHSINKLQKCFLAAYYLSGERKFLDPIQTLLDISSIATIPRKDDSLPADHKDNVTAFMVSQATPLIRSIYRWVSADGVYDQYGLVGSMQYMVDKDLKQYGQSFKKLAGELRHDWAKRTSEVLQTDRAVLYGAVDVLGAYTGAVDYFIDGSIPTMAVTWDTPDINFAAVVESASRERLRIRVYNFNETATPMGIRPWRLVPGIYVLNSGEVIPSEPSGPERYRWGRSVELEHRHRGSPIGIEVPSRKEWIIDLRLRKAIERPALAGDLAIGRRDLRLEGGCLIVTVHNIGGARVGPFDAAVQVEKAGRWSELTRTRLEGLPAISNFEPVRVDVVFPVAADKQAGNLRVVLDPDDRVEEICELNNSVTIVKDGDSSHRSE